MPRRGHPVASQPGSLGTHRLPVLVGRSPTEPEVPELLGKHLKDLLLCPRRDSGEAQTFSKFPHGDMATAESPPFDLWQRPKSSVAHDPHVPSTEEAESTPTTLPSQGQRDCDPGQSSWTRHVPWIAHPAWAAAFAVWFSNL